MKNNSCKFFYYNIVDCVAFDGELRSFFITIISIDMNKQAKLKQDQDVAKDDLTIILSYPHVYRFKPICLWMIVAVLNCHSSVITIMEKNDNILCINYTIKTGTVREQVQNLLKRLLFHQDRLFFVKTACKAA